MIDIRPLSSEAALYITLNLRPEDAREIYALRADDNPVSLAADILAAARAGIGWEFRYRGRPAALAGAAETWPGRWETFVCGAEDWPHVALGLTRFVRRRIRPLLIARGARRVDVFSHAAHVSAHRWLERLGARRDAILQSYGGDGADYIIYTWTNASNR